MYVGSKEKPTKQGKKLPYIKGKDPRPDRNYVDSTFLSNSLHY